MRMKSGSTYREGCRMGRKEMLSMKGRKISALLMVVFLLAALSSQAAEPQPPVTQQTSDADAELVKQSQNPVADLISVPFQYNFNFSAGPKHNHQILLLNIQ